MNNPGRPPQFDPLYHINSLKNQENSNQKNPLASNPNSKLDENPLVGSSKYSPYLGTQQNMFSPQTAPGSPFVANSPPAKKLRNDFYHPTDKLNTIGQNTSFARSYSSGAIKAQKLPSQSQALAVQHAASESDEDERFLRLAREALVATASGVSSTLVDPTIQDLLTRLQYASSPHGNPIKRSESIRANQNGQLMIQGFYQQFPNLSNDIFTGASPVNSPEEPKTTPNHPSTYNEGWNFLIGEPMVLKGPQYNKTPEVRPVQKQEHDDDDEEEDISDEPDAKSSSARKNTTTGDPSRKFLCSKCSMSFRRSSDLKRHEKQHLTIPPNICELCGKGFARKDALKRHVGTLTCKRNADRKLYADNLNYLPKAPFDSSSSSKPDNW